jgi:hypothetical protein
MREFVALAGPHGDPVEEALGIAVEIAQAFGLQAVGDHAKEEVPGRWSGAFGGTPTASGPEVEIAHARDLFPEVAHRCDHDQAACRDVVLV